MVWGAIAKGVWNFAKTPAVGLLTPAVQWILGTGSSSSSSQAPSQPEVSSGEKDLFLQSEKESELQFYEEPFPVAAEVGIKVTVVGILNADAKSFSINLTATKEHPASITLLCVEADFNKNRVYIKYTKEDGDWDDIKQRGGIPFKEEDHVECEIYFQKDKYQIFFNEEHFCDFTPKHDYKLAAFVVVAGDFKVHNVAFKK